MVQHQQRSSLGSKPYRKATKHEMQTRIHETALMLAAAQTRSMILRHLSEKHGVSERSGEDYIRRARELIAEDMRVERQDFAGELMASANLVARKAMQSGDLRCVLLARRFQAELTQMIGHGNRNM